MKNNIPMWKWCDRCGMRFDIKKNEIRKIKGKWICVSHCWDKDEGQDVKPGDVSV